MNKEDLEKIIKSNVDRPMHFGGAFKDDSFNKVMDAIEQYTHSQTETLKNEIEELRKEREWISVKDELPKEQCHCFVIAPKSFPKNCEVVVAEFYEDNKIFYSESSDYPMEDVTHWMPLPPPPKTK